jgi:hypothetical protein
MKRLVTKAAAVAVIAGGVVFATGGAASAAVPPGNLPSGSPTHYSAVRSNPDSALAGALNGAAYQCKSLSLASYNTPVYTHEGVNWRVDVDGICA